MLQLNSCCPGLVRLFDRGASTVNDGRGIAQRDEFSRRHLNVASSEILAVCAGTRLQSCRFGCTGQRPAHLAPGEMNGERLDTPSSSIKKRLT